MDNEIEERLTLYRLNVLAKLGISLRTANGLEALRAQPGQLPDKVEGDRRVGAQHPARKFESEVYYPRWSMIESHCGGYMACRACDIR